MVNPIAGYAAQAQNLTQLQSGSTVSSRGQQTGSVQEQRQQLVSAPDQQGQTQRTNAASVGTPNTGAQNSNSSQNDSASQRLAAQTEEQVPSSAPRGSIVDLTV